MLRLFYIALFRKEAFLPASIPDWDVNVRLTERSMNSLLHMEKGLRVEQVWKTRCLYLAGEEGDNLISNYLIRNEFPFLGFK